MNCPKCNGLMWDNRPRKADGTYKLSSPDYKCQDKQCGGAIWPETPPKQRAPARVNPVPPVVPPSPPATRPLSGSVDWALMAVQYQKATAIAVLGLTKALGCQPNDLDQAAVQAGAATILIRADSGRYNVKAVPPPAPKPPAPKPPPPPQPLDEFPEALEELDEDGNPMPF